MRVIFPTASNAELMTLLDLAQPENMQQTDKSLDEDIMNELSEVFRWAMRAISFI